jgi:hypothetical protein
MLMCGWMPAIHFGVSLQPAAATGADPAAVWHALLDGRLTRTLTLLDWAGTSLVGPLLGATDGDITCSFDPAGFARLYNLQLVDMQRTLLQVG